MNKYDLPFADGRKNPFWFCQLDEIADFQHRIDKHAAGLLGANNPATFDKEKQKQYLMHGLTEEAIHSSQLEGAATTRIVARKILAQKKHKPTNHDEKMIVNNYRAMRFIEEHKTQPLNLPIILELHRILTDGTLPEEADAGRLRRRDDIVVSDNLDGAVMHQPPPAADLYARMENLCDFANGITPKQFLHPALRAFMLHFMLAFEHPFVDGNGRTARALFYWAMAKYGYWFVAFLSISEIIKQAPRKYYHAFLHTETDNNDMTYFILHQIRTLDIAVEELNKYINRSAVLRKTKSLDKKMLQSGALNYRQAAFLHYAAEHTEEYFSARAHQALHQISYPTARADLLALANKGLLIRRKTGKEYQYELSPKALARMK